MRTVIVGLAALMQASAWAAAVGAPDTSQVIEHARPNVVSVEVTDWTGELPPALDPWDRRTADDSSSRPGRASGFLLEGGWVVTNQHIVQGARGLRVRFEEGTVVDAQLTGADELTDIAVLRVSAPLGAERGLKLADSTTARAGDWVLALGNPTGDAVIASAGILSAKARSIQPGPYEDFIQTDAMIHPANSGGPLLDLRGEVLGVNTAVLGTASGIGFAVPSHVLQALLPQLVTRGHAARGWLGAYVTEITPSLAHTLRAPTRSGAVITQRLSGSPADRAGLQPDDVLARVDGQAIVSASWLVKTLAARAPGTSLGLTLYRHGKRRTIRVVLGELPEWTPVPQEQTAAASPWEPLGLALDPSYRDKGARLAFVRPGSVAAAAGLCEGAVVREAAGRAIRSADELERALLRLPRGARLLLRVELPQLPYPRLRALRIP